MTEIEADRTEFWLPKVEPHLPEVYQGAEQYMSPELAVNLIKDGYLKLAVIHDEDELLGFGISRFDQEPSGYRWLVDVHSYILPGSRRRGLWKQYQDWLTHVARRCGCRGVMAALRWDDQDTATALARYGFEPMLSVWKREIEPWHG